MNRLSPLIVRRVGPMAAAASGSLPAQGFDDADSAGYEDLRLFVTAWLGGLVFFATFLA